MTRLQLEPRPSRAVEFVGVDFWDFVANIRVLVGVVIAKSSLFDSVAAVLGARAAEERG